MVLYPVSISNGTAAPGLIGPFIVPETEFIVVPVALSSNVTIPMFLHDDLVQSFAETLDHSGKRQLRRW